jgi:hypothetical protein
VRDLIPFLERLLTKLEPHLGFFHQISEAGGGVELFCGIWMDTNWDEIVPFALSGRLSALKIDLRLDAYPYATASQTDPSASLRMTENAD